MDAIPSLREAGFALLPFAAFAATLFPPRGCDVFDALLAAMAHLAFKMGTLGFVATEARLQGDGD